MPAGRHRLVEGETRSLLREGASAVAGAVSGLAGLGRVVCIHEVVENTAGDLLRCGCVDPRHAAQAFVKGGGVADTPPSPELHAGPLLPPPALIAVALPI